MSAKVKLTVKVTGDSSVEFDVVMSTLVDGFDASIAGLGLTADGSSPEEALQGLVKKVQSVRIAPEAPQLVF